MKVLREPVPIAWSIEKECIADINYGDVGCEALLEVDISDIYTKPKPLSGWDDLEGTSYTYYSQIFAFKCPCCGKETAIKDNEIPIKIRKIITNREKEKKELDKGKKLSKTE